MELRPDLITPSVYVAYEGSSVNFNCTSDLEPDWSKGKHKAEIPIHTIWYGDDPTLHTIFIYNLRVHHTGTYNCHGIIEGKFFEAVARLFVGSEYYYIS